MKLTGTVPAEEPAWNPKDYAKDLAPTSLGSIDGEIKKLADEITKGKAVYDWTVENTFCHPEARGCGKGEVTLANY